MRKSGTGICTSPLRTWPSTTSSRIRRSAPAARSSTASSRTLRPGCSRAAACGSSLERAKARIRFGHGWPGPSGTRRSSSAGVASRSSAPRSRGPSGWRGPRTRGLPPGRAHGTEEHGGPRLLSIRRLRGIRDGDAQTPEARGTPMTTQGRARHIVRWRRLDRPGIERATLSPSNAAWHLDGRIETDFGEGPARIRYRLSLDEAWRTQAAWATLREGPDRRRIELFVRDHPDWFVTGAEQANLRGCIDLDLEASPATNTIPIRRLDLKVGEARAIRVAWIRFPELRVEPVDQRYARGALRRYRFENVDSGYTTELKVDEEGLVLEYSGLWTRSP